MRAALRFGAAAGGGRGASSPTGTLSVETPLSLRTLARGSAGRRVATGWRRRSRCAPICSRSRSASWRRSRDGRAAIAGTAAVRLDLRGSARAPAGALEPGRRSARTGRAFPRPTCASTPRSARATCALAAQVARKQQLLAWANAVAEIPAARLGDRAALEQRADPRARRRRSGRSAADAARRPRGGRAIGSPAAKTGGDGALHARARRRPGDRRDACAARRCARTRSCARCATDRPRRARSRRCSPTPIGGPRSTRS